MLMEAALAMGLRLDPGGAIRQKSSCGVRGGRRDGLPGNAELTSQLLALSGACAQVADAAAQAGGSIGGFIGADQRWARERSGRNGWATPSRWVFEQAIYGQALSIVMERNHRRRGLRGCDCGHGGTSISEAISAAAIDTMVAKAPQQPCAQTAFAEHDGVRAQGLHSGLCRSCVTALAQSITPHTVRNV
ncbi:hypothetical protein FQR65_LT18802 [Abscondita terminalis]|nr:hypothetical protein FQR65_LT18802 [Abscondita terminalis]